MSGMMFQTITKDVNALVHIDDKSDFIQTEFDAEIQSFINSLVEDYQLPVSTSFMTSNEKIICVITYVEMTDEQKQAMSAQKSGLTLLKQKL